jgi:hypothetical protein
MSPEISCSPSNSIFVDKINKPQKFFRTSNLQMKEQSNKLNIIYIINSTISILDHVYFLWDSNT